MPHPETPHGNTFEISFGWEKLKLSMTAKGLVAYFLIATLGMVTVLWLWRHS